MSSTSDTPEPLPSPPGDGPSLGRSPPGRTTPPGQALPPAGTTIGTPPEISSDALLGGRAEIRIRHRGEIYRLSLTRAGKLILHK
jgi:hemin uptake protein HemP